MVCSLGALRACCCTVVRRTSVQCWLSPVQIMFDARNKQFDTVMAALGSNSERWGIFTISLEFARQASGTSEGGAP